MAWVVDLDGVVWLADQLIPGSAEAVATLREAGVRVVFLTNNSSLTVGEYVDKLRRVGVETRPEDLVSSAEAAASLVEPGSRVLCAAGAGVVEALRRRGARLCDAAPADAVVVGFHREFDFDRLTAATRAVLGGARLIGTNADATYPTPHGLLPGAGALLAAVSYATGTTPTVAGKPSEWIAKVLTERLGGETVEVVVGDRPETDGRFARLLGARFALVRSGVTPPGREPLDPAPDLDAADLRAAVVTLLRPSR